MRYSILSQMNDVLNDVPMEILKTVEFRDTFLICFADMTNKIAHGESSLYDWHIFVSILCTKRDDSKIFHFFKIIVLCLLFF